MDYMSKNRPSTSITHDVAKLKLCPIVKSSMNSWPAKWETIGRVAVYYAGVGHAFSEGIRYRHCSYQNLYVIH